MSLFFAFCPEHNDLVVCSCGISKCVVDPAWPVHLYSAEKSLFLLIFTTAFGFLCTVVCDYQKSLQIFKSSLPEFETMSTGSSSPMALKKTTIPSIQLVLTSAGPGHDECGLCGNDLEITPSPGESCGRLPCMDSGCEDCARMWRILKSPICQACYAGFSHPKANGDQAQISSTHLHIGASNAPLEHSQRESSLGPRDRYVAFHGADADSDNDTISDPGSPMRENDDDISAVSEIGDENLQSALIEANNRVGTNFNFQEIEDDMYLMLLRTGTKTELVAKLTQLCMDKACETQLGIANASESDEEPRRDEDMSDEDPSNETTLQNSGAKDKAKTWSCKTCHKTFRSSGHLKQHMVIHTIERRTCSFCGKILKSPAGKRIHEVLHWETDSKRKERLGKEKLARDKRRRLQASD